MCALFFVAVVVAMIGVKRKQAPDHGNHKEREKEEKGVDERK